MHVPPFGGVLLSQRLGNGKLPVGSQQPATLLIDLRLDFWRAVDYKIEGEDADHFVHRDGMHQFPRLGTTANSADVVENGRKLKHLGTEFAIGVRDVDVHSPDRRLPGVNAQVGAIQRPITVTRQNWRLLGGGVGIGAAGAPASASMLKLLEGMLVHPELRYIDD